MKKKAASGQVYKNKKFKLFDQAYTVKFCDKVYLDGEEETPKETSSNWKYGYCRPSKGEICVSTKLHDGTPLSKDTIETTFLHELTHCIFAGGQYNEEFDDEPMVEWIGRCLQTLMKQKVFVL